MEDAFRYLSCHPNLRDDYYYIIRDLWDNNLLCSPLLVLALWKGQKTRGGRTCPLPPYSYIHTSQTQFPIYFRPISDISQAYLTHMPMHMHMHMHMHTSQTQFLFTIFYHAQNPFSLHHTWLCQILNVHWSIGRYQFIWIKTRENSKL